MASEPVGGHLVLGRRGAEEILTEPLERRVDGAGIREWTVHLHLHLRLLGDRPRVVSGENTALAIRMLTGRGVGAIEPLEPIRDLVPR